MANVLVTGGCGRIGRQLVRSLREKGDRITVIDFKHGDVEGVKYITAPIGEITDLGKVDIVYHLAASINYGLSKEELSKRNVLPTAQLLGLCQECKQFIFMSTTSVYGESEEAIDEEAETNPYSNYGWSKLQAERIVRTSGVPYTILRSSQVYGPNFEEGYNKVLRKIQEGAMKILGDGTNYIPLVHVNDLIDALLLVRNKKPALNQVFNVDGGYHKTQEEFMNLAAKMLGVEPPSSHIHPLLAGMVARLTGKGGDIVEYMDKLTKNREISIEKIRNIGFRPGVDLEKGIMEVVDSFRKEGILD
jgi:nucleoside-diphosphate-sugar epimerase